MIHLNYQALAQALGGGETSAPVAQWIEHWSSEPGVARSNRAGCTKERRVVKSYSFFFEGTGCLNENPVARMQRGSFLSRLWQAGTQGGNCALRVVRPGFVGKIPHPPGSLRNDRGPARLGCPGRRSKSEYCHRRHL